MAARVRHMLVLDDPERIDRRAQLVHGDLLEVDVRRIVRIQTGVPVVLAVERTPGGHFAEERFTALLAAGRTGHQMHRGAGIRVRCFARSVVHLQNGGVSVNICMHSHFYACYRKRIVLSSTFPSYYCISYSIHTRTQMTQIKSLCVRCHLISSDAKTKTDLVVVDRPQTLVRMLMRPDLDVDAVLVEQRLQPEEMRERQPDADQRFAVRAIVVVVVAAVHRPMAEGDDPRSLGPGDTILFVCNWQTIIPRVVLTDSPACSPRSDRVPATRTD